MSRVLLTGARAPATLHLARLLRAEGATVFVADSCRFPVARASSTVQGFFKLPAPAQHPQAFLDCLHALVETHAIDWLIPTCEEVFYVAQGLASLQARCRVLTDNLETLRRLHHKWAFTRLVDDPDVQAPETHLIDSADSLRAWKRQSWHYVFKPVYSRFASQTLIQPEPAVLDPLKPSQERPWVAQQFIAGTEYSSYSVSHAGKLRLHCAYHAPYRAGRGAGIYFQPVRNPVIESFVARLAEQLNYTGQLAFDFMADRQGRLFVLECNPRLTSGIHLYAPQDRMVAALLNETPSARSALSPHQDTPAMLGAMMGLYGPGQTGLPEWWRDVRRGRDVMGVPGDFAPLFYQALSLAEMGLRRFNARSSFLAATTLDIEWNGHGEPD